MSKEKSLYIWDRKAIANDGDYIKDDLLHCGQCHTAKELKIKMPFDVVPRKVPRMCKCAEEAYREREKANRERDFNLWKSNMIDKGIGGQLNRQSTFARDDQSNAQVTTICKKYVERWDQVKLERLGIMFYGAVGTGKSFYALCIANALIDKGISVKFTSIAKELNRIQGAYAEDRENILNELAKVDLLILDDIGAERNTSYASEQIYNIVNGRYESNKPLVTTTNLNLADFKNTQDMAFGRIYDRILAMCQVRLKVTGKSKRITQAKNIESKASEILGL